MPLFRRLVDLASEIDTFGVPITPRYRRENDYKSCCGAMVTLILIVFFGLMFVNLFKTMWEVSNITTSATIKQESDPAYFATNTTNFMFAVGLKGINMNDGARYLTIKADVFTVQNNTKTNITVNLVPCEAEMWYPLGDDKVYERYGLNQLLCPAPGQEIELQGKDSSDIYKYIKISATQCSGVVNNQGCRPVSDIQSYIDSNETFTFSYYFINTLINVDQENATSLYLNDQNTFVFSPSLGTSCSLEIENYEITTDVSITPFPDQHYQDGIMATKATKVSNFIPNQGEFMKFEVKKSTQSRVFDRKYYKFDELLAYIGGLFGLIVALLGPLIKYYNTCCFELSMATDLFTYPQRDPPVNPNPQVAPEGAINDQRQPNQQPQPPSRKNFPSEPHTINSWNFLVYILYLPFLFLKKCGWNSLRSKKLSPYYEAIEQTRRHVDLCKMLERFIYMERMSNSLLDEDQRKLLHVFPKEKIQRPELKATTERVPYRGTNQFQKLIDNMVDIEDHPNPIKAEDFRDAHERLLKHIDNPVNFRILAIINNDLNSKRVEVGADVPPEQPRGPNAAGVARNGSPQELIRKSRPVEPSAEQMKEFRDEVVGEFNPNPKNPIIVLEAQTETNIR